MFVTSRGYRIRYQTFGAGPVVVLLHGHPMWGDRWVDRGYADGLADRFRVVVPDLLGHGDSDKPRALAAYGNPHMAADVLAVLDAEGASAAHVWGYSWGAMIAENLAAASPGRVVSLILGGWPVGSDSTQRAAIQAADGEAPASIEEMFADWPPAIAEAYVARNDFDAILAVRQTLFSFPTTLADLHTVRHRTLSYYGADDIHFELARKQAAALPCRFQPVPGDHVMAFAQADHILPTAIAHFAAADAKSTPSTADS